MSDNDKRAEFEIALLYNEEAARKAKSDIESLTKSFDELGKRSAKIGGVAGNHACAQSVSRPPAPRAAEQELKALAMVTRADQKRRDAYSAWWDKSLKSQEAAAKREERQIERDATLRVRESNALRAAEEKAATALAKQRETDRKRERIAIAKEQREIERIEKRRLADEKRARTQAHREELRATNEVRRASERAARRAEREKRASERRTLRYEQELARIKDRTAKAEWRHQLRLQQKRDRMRSEGVHEGASMLRSGATRAGAATLAAGTAGVMAHLEMSRGVGEIMTLKPNLTEAETKAMIKGGMSNYGGTTAENSKAIYDIVSSGFGDSKEHLQEVFDAASNLAVGGVTDVATAADGLTSALNAWKDKGYTATNVTDQFFQAAKEGKVTIEQLSSNLGTFAAMAQTAGVSLEESMAVIAETTKQGVQAGSASSGLRQMIKSITNPTKQAEKAARSMGVKVGSAAIKNAGGLEGWFNQMLSSKHYSDDKMQQIFSDVDGKILVDVLKSLKGGGFSAAVARQKNAGGSTQDAVNTMMATDYMRAQKIMGEVRVALVEFGEAIMPLVRDALPHVTDSIRAFRKWLEAPEHRQMLISATKVALMIGGVAAVGGPLAQFIKVLNLLSAGAVARTFSGLTSSVAGTTGVMGPLGVAVGLLTGAIVAGAHEARVAAQEFKTFVEEMTAVEEKSADWEDMDKDVVEPAREQATKARAEFDELAESSTLMSDTRDLLFTSAREFLPKYVTGIEKTDLTRKEVAATKLEKANESYTTALTTSHAFKSDLLLTRDTRYAQGGEVTRIPSRAEAIRAAGIIRETIDPNYAPAYLQQSPESAHREYEELLGQSREFHRASEKFELIPAPAHTSLNQSQVRDRVDVGVTLKLEGEENMKKMIRSEYKKMQRDEGRSLVSSNFALLP
jgi:TP901 family phage tail tape measure protein